MLAQTTNSGGNNGRMAEELKSMFASAEDPGKWDASSHHVQCYAHKLKLVVGHGLYSLGQKVSTAKPTTKHGFQLPIPALKVNNSEDELDINDSPSDNKDEDNLPEKPEGVDNEDTAGDQEEVCDKDESP